MERQNRSLSNRIRKYNAGFTLVELVVVLALLVILMGITIFGGLAWQDWMRFQHEDSVAEELFFAAQNQLVELDASGATERKFRSLQDGGSYEDKYVLAYYDVNLKKAIEGNLSNIIRSDGRKYSWDNLWASGSESGEAIGLNVNKSDARTILKLSARSGDYNRYLEYKSTDAVGRANMLSETDGITLGTVMLFDLVSPYVSDTAALNGAILLELSPETGQVFSALYSDRAEMLTYESTTTSGTVSVLDRRIASREPVMLGYYGVDQLTERIRGKGIDNTPVQFELRNGEVLEIVLRQKEDGFFDKVKTLNFEIYDGTNGANDSTAMMAFVIPYEKIPKASDHSNESDMLVFAAENPVNQVKVSFSKGDYNGEEDLMFRFPAWIDYNNAIHIVLDAADVQAQTSIYEKAKKETDKLEPYSKSEQFRNTFSFYRFGLAGQTNYIYGSMTATLDNASENDSNATTDSIRIFSSRAVNLSGENPTGYVEHKELYNQNGKTGSCGECTTFDSYALSSELKPIGSTGEEGSGEQTTITVEKRCFGLSNARHLYNMRYETECKSEGAKDNVFTLTANIDWNSFVGKVEGTEHNYFLNSYDASYSDRVVSGLDYDGENKATGSTGVKTANMPFPGFRCLGKGDTFTQAVAFGATDGEGNSVTSYTISNLTISFAANIAYGIYDVVFDNTELNKKNYSREKFLAGTYSDKDILGMETYGNGALSSLNEKLSSRAHLTRGGALPLGLFAENLGTISNITLSNHTVRGFEESYITGKENSVDHLLTTNMVGGFAGNNLGYISNLTLGEGSVVNGRTDVGGIIGRESYIVTDGTTNTATEDITISGMKNYGMVTGLENVGGIVGRAYTHFVGEANQERNYSDAFAVESTLYNSEAQNPRYLYYHDRYYITDNNTSMTGQKVARVGKITIADCSNRGLVAGNATFVNGKYKTDGKLLAKGTFIGGIAGVAMDGYIADHRKIRIGSADGITPLKQYEEDGFFRGEFSFVEISNCDSYVKGIQEASHQRDNYIGGLVGYLRYAYVKDCNQKPEETLWTEGAPDCYVTGQSYVGGLFGCSDNCVYLKKSEEDDYAVTNYNNVIGEKYVGGIAGATGIGDVSQQTFSIWNPSGLGVTQPSQYQYENSDKVEVDNTKYIAGRDMLNTAVVLGKKSDKPMSASAGNGWIGGVYGVTRVPFINADNIQTQAVKKLAMKLITNSDTNLYTLDASSLQTSVIANSAYGGNCVGGIAGNTLGYDWMNDDGTENCSSKVDAVVFGQDYVGGVIGYTVNAKVTGAKNAYPVVGADSGDKTKGLLVVGRDGVGGLYGSLRYKDNGEALSLKDPVTSPFRVIGRYGVGGFFGIISVDNSSRLISFSTELQDNDRIQVSGIVYTGGLAGVMEYPINASSTISIQKIDVSSKYSAGGLYGAIGLRNDPDKVLSEVTNGNVSLGSNITVKADAFAGGIAGIYAGAKLTSFNGSMDGQLRVLAESVSGQECPVAYTTVMDNSSICGTGTKNQTITFSDYANSKASISGTIEAQIFAGGLFGYAPDQTKTVTVTGFVNGASIRTTGSVTNVSEMSDNSSKYSYLGGVTGRVPTGMILVKCANQISGAYVDDVTPYYSADQATWLGGLTEVNAGQISGTTKKASGQNNYTNDTRFIDYCINETVYDYSSSDSIQGVGAFAGVNGTMNTDGESSGVISFCSNQAEIKAKIAAGISAALGGSSDILYSENRGRVLSSDDVSGVAAGIAGVGTSSITGRSLMVTSCVNLGDINLDNEGSSVGKYSAGIVYSTGGCGNITNCRNYGPGAEYGITGALAARVYANAEVSGLGEDEEHDPVAPMESEDLERNFYIFGEKPYVVDNTKIDNETVLNYGSVYYTTTIGGSLKKHAQDNNWNYLDVVEGISIEDTKSFSMKDGSLVAEGSSEGSSSYNLNGFDLTYDVFDGKTNESSGVYMKSFNLYFYLGWITKQIYEYDITFDYQEESTGAGSTTIHRKIEDGVAQNEMCLVDSFPIPATWKVSSVRIQVTREHYNHMANKNDGAKAQVYFPLYCAYWMDSDGKHYMVSKENTETFFQDKQANGTVVSTIPAESVYTSIVTGTTNSEYNTCIANKPYEKQVNKVTDWIAYYELYGKQPDATIGWPPSGFSADLYPVPSERINADSNLKNYYDDAISNGTLSFSTLIAWQNPNAFINLDVYRPMTGLPADGIKLYMYNLDKFRHKSGTTYHYLVTVTFYDRYGVKRTAENQRNLVTDSTIDYFCDTINFGVDNYNDPIRPTNIRIQFNPTNNSAFANYIAICGLTYFKGTMEKVFLEKGSTAGDIVEGLQNSYTAVENAYVAGDSSVQGAGNQNKWKFSVSPGDTWSKQLFVQEGETGESYHFIYKRNGVFQNDYLMSGLGEYSGGEVEKKASILATQNTMENRLAVYGNLDKKLLAFLKDEEGQPSSKFVDN